MGGSHTPDGSPVAFFNAILLPEPSSNGSWRARLVDWAEDDDHYQQDRGQQLFTQMAVAWCHHHSVSTRLRSAEPEASSQEAWKMEIIVPSAICQGWKEGPDGPITRTDTDKGTMYRVVCGEGASASLLDWDVERHVFFPSDGF